MEEFRQVTENDLLEMKGIELSAVHAEIVAQREWLLRGMEAINNEGEATLGSLFPPSCHQAVSRNTELIENLERFKQRISERRTRIERKHATLEKNYATMVRNMVPGWIEELRDYREAQIRRYGLEEYNSEPDHRLIDRIIAGELEEVLNAPAPEISSERRKRPPCDIVSLSLEGSFVRRSPSPPQTGRTSGRQTGRTTGRTINSEVTFEDEPLPESPPRGKKKWRASKGKGKGKGK